jgi:lysozyme
MPFVALGGIIIRRITVMTNLKNWVKTCEGLKLKPYKDTADSPKITIGYGRNLTDNGISLEEAEFLFENDFARVQKELSNYNWYKIQPTEVQYALINMCFNLGITKLLGFTRMISALIMKDYTKAAAEALNSKWATQVGQRAKDIAVMIREGK